MTRVFACKCLGSSINAIFCRATKRVASSRERLAFPSLLDVTVEIGSGQNDKQRQFRVETVKFFDGWITAPGMQRDQQIAARAIIGLANVNSDDPVDVRSAPNGER